MPRILRRPGRRAVEPFRDGIHLDFARGVHYIKAAGLPATVAPFTSLFTFTGGNQSLYRGAAGLLIQSVTNTPRIEYDANGNLLGLLIEGARTNLCLQSEVIDNASWTKSGLAATPITANATAAPDGATTADKIVEASGGTFHLVRQDITVSANTAYSFSVFLASAGRTFARVQLSNSAEANGAYIDVNLTTGATGTATAFGTGSAQVATVTQYANGFWRVTIKCVIDAASTTARVQVLVASALGTLNYSGDGASGIYAWGAQLEAGSFPSSYIPTTTGSVARTVDACTRTLGSEFSTSVGTIFSHSILGSATGTGTPTHFSFDDTSGNERVISYYNFTNSTLRLLVTDGGAGQVDAAGGGTFTGNDRWAGAYATNDCATVLNGGTVGTDTSATMPTMTTLRLGNGVSGSDQLFTHFRRFDYWPERKSNAELQRLTA